MQLKQGGHLTSMSKKFFVVIGAFLTGGIGLVLLSAAPHAAEAGRVFN
jgi:hypothetical protein